LAIRPRCHRVANKETKRSSGSGSGECEVIC
jgi:hypothetical protein